MWLFANVSGLLEKGLLELFSFIEFGFQFSSKELVV